MTLTDELVEDRHRAAAARQQTPPAAGQTSNIPSTPGVRRSPDQSLASEVIATITLIAFTLAVAAGYARVFSGWQYFDDLAILAVVGHGVGFLTRRLRLPGIAAIPVLALVLGWMIAVVHYRDSMTLLIPNGDTLDVFGLEIDRVREEFRTAVAPVIYAGGWDVLASIGIALVVILSDTFAFRAYARAEALVPGGVLFVFVAALGSDRHRIALTALLVACGVAATIALRAHHGPQRTSAIGGRQSAFRRVVPAAVGVAVVVAAASALVGPRLPGAGEEPIYETRGGNGGRVTNVVSPLVDIRSRLTNRSNSELFTVEADFESYWRLSALPRFNGTTWGLPERSLSRVDGQLTPARDGSNELRQQIVINALGEQFVPAAPDPQAASPQDALRFNADSATLLKSDGELQPGDTFEILSAAPRFDVSVLQNATSTNPGDQIYFELPRTFPSSVGELAREVTAGANTPFEVALTLQDWFRDNFDYSLEVQAGHSTTAIEGFLRDRVGYCEQFAGTYSAMLRTLGIASRVAVGFTPGNFNGERFSVLGKNAHAWPEVWFDGIGWVPFEPTPGRGAPGSENYTNVEPQQDSSGVDPDAPTAEPGDDPDAVPDGGIAPATTVLPIPENELVPDPALPVGEDALGAPEDAATEGGGSVPVRGLLVVALIGLLLAAPELVRQIRRRRTPADPTLAVAELWRRSRDDLGEAGLRLTASATPAEQAVAAADKFPVIARPFGSLAAAMTEAVYAPDSSSGFDGVSDSNRRVEECRQWSRQIERAVNDSISTSMRVKRYFTRLS